MLILVYANDNLFDNVILIDELKSFGCCLRVFGLVGLVQSVLPRDCHVHFNQHHVKGNASRRFGWMAVWCSCVWSLWLTRNEKIFKNTEVNVNAVFENVKFRSWNWIRSFAKDFSYSFFEWSMNPRLCINGIS